MMQKSPVLLLFVLMAVGALLGNIRVKGVGIGSAAVLFTALAFSAADKGLELPDEIGVLGLALFAYTIGVSCGPTFFTALRTGLKPMIAVVVVLVGAAGVAYGIGQALGLHAGSVAGLYAGSLTNTPALAAATERLNGAASPTVAYSITYLFGVLGMLTAAGLVLRRGQTAPLASDLDVLEPIEAITVTVQRRDLPTLAEITRMRPASLVFGQVRRPSGDQLAATGDLVLEPEDLVTVIGHGAAARDLVAWLGERNTENLTLDRRHVDFRRITVSRSLHAGATIGELQLGARFGAVATRLRRGDRDLVATLDQVVAPGDRIRVVAPRDKISEVASYLGDSESGMSDINPFGMALGLALGLTLGMIKLPMVGIGSFVLGSAGGPLIVGLIVGRLQRTGPIVWSIPRTASSSLNQFGVYAFLAWAGSHAGSEFIDAIASPLGAKLAAGGFVVTAVTAGAIALTCREVFGISGPALAGMMGAAQTQPAVLAFAAERAKGDERVHIGWSLIYPAAMITKIVAATILAGL